MYLKGLWNWPIFMLIKVQEMEASYLKYITAPRKTYCALSHIFQEPIFKSTFNLCAPCFCLHYQSTSSIHPPPALAQPSAWDGPVCRACPWGQRELGQWLGRSWSAGLPHGGRWGREKITNLHRQHSQRGQYLNFPHWMITEEREPGFATVFLLQGPGEAWGSVKCLREQRSHAESNLQSVRASFLCLSG